MYIVLVSINVGRKRGGGEKRGEAVQFICIILQDLLALLFKVEMTCTIYMLMVNPLLLNLHALLPTTLLRPLFVYSYSYLSQCQQEPLQLQNTPEVCHFLCVRKNISERVKYKKRMRKNLIYSIHNRLSLFFFFFEIFFCWDSSRFDYGKLAPRCCNSNDQCCWNGFRTRLH